MLAVTRIVGCCWRHRGQLLAAQRAFADERAPVFTGR
jgi:hypothetical protein